MPTLELKSTPAGKPLVAPIPFDPFWDGDDGGEPFRVRHLITKLVHETVRDVEYHERNRALALLTDETIAEGLRRGRIGSPREEALTVDLERAVGQALQAFEDGLFLLFVDRHEKRDLDEVVVLRLDTVVTLVRLTALMGG